MATQYCPYCMTPVTPGQACPNCGLTEGSYHAQPHHLPPGTVLAGRYQLGRVLGEGGFGITYIGCDLRLGVRVAVKEYYPNNNVVSVMRNNETTLAVTVFGKGGTDRTFDVGKEKFLREAKAMGRMDKNPYIVGVRDFFEENKTAYIVMEYIDGTTFKELVGQRGGKMSAKELLPMVEPLFLALEDLHQRGLIHRDISPDNLMLEKGKVKLIDFGCARETAGVGSESLSVVLKYGYSPIEQYQHKGQGPWTDVYPLAATLYFCLTGQRPEESIERVFDDELVAPRELGADLTESQEKALLKGMAVNPPDRFRSMKEFHAALFLNAEESAPAETKEEKPKGKSAKAKVEQKDAKAPGTQSATKKPDRRKFVLLGSAAVILLAVLVTVVVAVTHFGGTSVDSFNGEGEPFSSTQSSSDTSSVGLSAGDAAQTPAAEPIVLTGDPTLDELEALMNDPEVGSILIPAGCFIDLGPEDEVVIHKPVTIERGGRLNVPKLTIEGEGYLAVAGELRSRMIRLRGEGVRLSVESDTELNDEQLIWADENENFEWKSNGDLSGKIQRQTLVFAGREDDPTATVVKTREELEDALEHSASIHVSGDLSLEGLTLPQYTLLCIDAGVTVDGSMNVNENALLVNSGTFAEGHFDVFGMVINRGQMGSGAEYFFDYCLHDRSLLVNSGSILATDYSGSQVACLLNEAGAQISCFGRQELTRFSQLLNYGDIRFEFPGQGKTEIEPGFSMECGSYLRNYGTCTVGQGTSFRSRAFLQNYGTFTVEEGARFSYSSLENDGVLDDRTEDTGEWRGIVSEWGQSWPEETVSSLDALHGEVVEVTTPEQFIQSIQNADQPIWVSGTMEVELTEPMTTKNPVPIYVEGDLRVTGETLTVSGSTVVVGVRNDQAGSLTVDRLTLTKGARMITRNSRVFKVNEGGTLLIDESSCLALRGGDWDVSGANVTVDHRSWIAQMDTPNILGENAEILISSDSNAMIRKISGASVTVETRSWLFMHGESSFERCSLTMADGNLESSAESSFIDTAIRILGNGNMEVDGGHVEFSGKSSLENQGFVSINGIPDPSANTPALTFACTGAVENSGSIYLGGGKITFANGTRMTNNGTITTSGGSIDGNAIDGNIPEWE